MRFVTFALAVVVLLMPAQARADDNGLVGLERIVAAWLASPHGDYHSPSFTYWNEAGEVPESCAICHSETGFLDFLGSDGSEAGSVHRAGAINSPIGCASCHTAEAHALDAVTFPAGITVDGLGMEATCNVCHGGRQSGDAVVNRVADMDADTVSADLSFINIHYGPAAAVTLGADVRPGLQYDGRSYAGRFMHVPGAATCSDCHSPHSTQLSQAVVEGCVACHQGGAEDLRDIRTQHRDFAGTGDRSGGIHAEIVALEAKLFEAIRLYAAEVAGTPIAYGAGFPYFFVDQDGSGAATGDALSRDNRYQAFTPRLLKAAYNYQVSRKSPGGYVHNPRYMLQILHDSLVDLAEAVEIDVSGVSRP
ncbi:polyheme membrane-associated cytochrome C [Rhabdonatronobacter sediminivivens]|uniref:polyheme membrane-associated cytochrome C n=1 Tax=Rhabdonatronobacter sediminivivens TaxID=2743469 RepID=UPI001F37B4E6|nr:polyheme membrane-associated cytochrome C [Rhabdonatronobacter sediminivivens]